MRVLVLAGLGLRCCAGFSLVSESGSQASHCGGFACCQAWALGCVASVAVVRRLQSTGSIVVAHGLSCPEACGIFPDQGSNPCLLHW